MPSPATSAASADPLTRAVREQVALGRLLPLGGADDTSWITENAAVRVLRRACAGLPGIRLGAVDAALDMPSPDTPLAAPAPGAPAGALPHVPVRISAAFEAGIDEPLPAVAERLRSALWSAATDLLGLAVTAVDLRVTGLLDGPQPAPPADAPVAAGPAVSGGDPGGPLEVAALAVPGVVGLTAALAGFGSGLRVLDATADDRHPGRRVQIQIAVAPGLVPLQVARQVATAVTTAGAPGPVTVAVLVTDVG
ncbi:nucleopolyhedrovirus P10 family protein [Actinacidiphila acididurans]|nr:nucleopolyhedrovirus P10 family protein [Actinacidiphila acididurans]